MIMAKVKQAEKGLSMYPEKTCIGTEGDER
jgi:hypothetical protein